jgi:hypothetical protein
MGMFDWLNCDYPLPNGKPAVEPGRYDAASYQTKDLDNDLDVYRITADGRLVVDKISGWSDREAGEEVKHTGRISFYGGGNGMRDIFTAFFLEGRITKIVEGWGNDDDSPGLTLDQLHEFVAFTMPKFKRM